MWGSTMHDPPSLAATVTLQDDRPNQPNVAPLAPGTTIGRYVVVGHLGSGGMGTVYAAFDAQLQRRIAIKVLRPDARGTDGHTRLLREAQAMARLAHPNVVTVHEVGPYGDDVFLAMEYVEGQTLKRWMEEEHTWRERLAVLRAAGEGLAAAHRAGLVHRDFKPENVLIGADGRVVVADFGIARAQETEGRESAAPGEPTEDATLRDRHAPLGDKVATGRMATAAAARANAVTRDPSSARTPSPLETPLTQTGALLGTLGYMAPERALDGRDDARSDQFSFAVTAYRVLYGRPPFAYPDASTYLMALLSDPPPPPAKSPVPAWVQAVIARGLARAPEARFASMDDLLAALDRDPTRRRVAWASAAAILLAAVGVLFVRAEKQRAIRAKCAAGDALIEEAWSPRIREAVFGAMRASGAPHAEDTAERTARVLDDWSNGWKGAYREASEATLLRGVETDATMRARLGCLDRQREELAALTDRFAHADKATAHRAISAVYELPSPKRCWEPEAALAAALPSAAEPRARVVALQKELARASAMTITGGCDGVTEAANRGIEEARAIPHRLSEAQFLNLRAGCEWDSGDVMAANASRQRAFVAAVAAGDDSLAATTAAAIAFGYAERSVKTPEGEDWLAIGKGILEREGHDDLAESGILEAEVEILSSGGYAEKTLPLYERLIALDVRLFGPSHPIVAGEYNNYATDLNHAGRVEDGIAALRKAIAISEALYGPTAPMLYMHYNNVGFAFTQLGRYDDAREAIAHALELAKPFGPKSANLILPFASMAVVDNRSGRPEAALSDVAQAMAIAEGAGENGALYLPCLYEQRGRALLKRHDVAGAVAACAQGVKLQDEQGAIGPDKVYSDDALTCLGEAELAAGKVDAAITDLERSVTLTKRDWKAEVPIAKIDLAKALRARAKDGDQERARRLAEEGAGALRGIAGAEQREKDAEGWLAEWKP
jgi:serine/threonine protein kinase/tetratricopeptide (TPR) repeat protein